MTKCCATAAISRWTGCALPVVAISKQDGTLDGPAEIITRGFVTRAERRSALGDGARMLADDASQRTSLEERTDPGLIKEKVRDELRRFLRKRSGRRPLVLPVIMEI